MNIFVGNLSASVTPGDLRQLFAGYGTIINAIVMRDTASGLPLGYGHVYLVPEDAAQEAIAHLRDSSLKDSPITVRQCVFRAQPERRVKRLTWKRMERRVMGSRRHNGQNFSPSASPQNQAGRNRHAADISDRPL